MDGPPGFWHAAWLARFSLLGGLANTLELSVLAILLGTGFGLVGGTLLHYGG